MKILLTGATGYIGKRLLPLLVQEGHTVVCAVRDPVRMKIPSSLQSKTEVIQADLLNPATLENIPKDIDAAYYLVHSMSNSKDYSSLEEQSALNFISKIEKTQAQQIIYLSGIINEKQLSKHLNSRKKVEEVLNSGNIPTTTLRAGIIIGSGSASFEIIRDLVEKLPFMITPKWLRTKCQPISVSDVLKYLLKSLGNKNVFNKNMDIGGPDILSYKEMLLGFAKVRGLKRKILIVPVMTPRLSSYWLYFVTATSYKLAVALVNSMKIEVVCRDNSAQKILGITPLSYEESLVRAFEVISNNLTLSSWKDSMISGNNNFKISEFIEVPNHGCFTDQRILKVKDKQKTISKLWSIGGENGWYYANILWKFRGYLDKLVGGVGLRRGRTNPIEIETGDALDFWRVLYANKKEGRLLLFAEMKLPGEAWLEFKIVDDEIHQTATFRPKGIIGRLYWYSVLPLHGIVFKGMISELTRVNHESN